MKFHSILFTIFLTSNTFGGLVHWLAPDSGINCMARMNLQPNNNTFKTAVGFLSLEGVERIFSTILISYILLSDPQNYDTNIVNIAKLLLIKTVTNHITHKYYKTFPTIHNAPGRFRTAIELVLLMSILIINWN